MCDNNNQDTADSCVAKCIKDQTPLCGSEVNKRSNCTNVHCTGRSAMAATASTLAKPMQIVHQLNGIYEKRLAEIETEANGDLELKTINYKEWVDMLMGLIRDLFDTVEELESEASNRIELLEKKLQTDCKIDHNAQQEDLRNDLNNLLELIRRSIEDHEWNDKGLDFKTMTREDIFGGCVKDGISSKLEEKSSPEMDLKMCALTKENECLKTRIDELELQLCKHDKLADSMKALAFEVAEKHDTIRELRLQVFSLDDEIQNAQKKIQLKDDVIRELRNDFKFLQKCDSCADQLMFPSSRKSSGISSSRRTSSRASSPDRHIMEQSHNTSTSTLQGDSEFCYMDSEIESTKLRCRTFEERCYLKTLNSELEQLFVLQSAQYRGQEEQNKLMSMQQNKVTEVVKKMLCDLKETQHKLDYIRKELVNIDCHKDSGMDCTKVDSGYTSVCEREQDCKILCSVKRRIQCLQDENVFMKSKVQSLELDVLDATTKVCKKSEIIENNGKILNEITSTLENVCGKEISYETFVPDNFLPESCASSSNPLCDAIDCLHRSTKEQEIEICRLNETMENLNRQLGSKDVELCAANDELDFKDKMICDLKNRLSCQDESLQELESHNASQTAEVCEYKQQNNSSKSLKYDQLLKIKCTLEKECQNQLFTITSLREALESCKRHSGGPSTFRLHSNGSTNSESDNSSNNANWGWWRGNNVHDV